MTDPLPLSPAEQEAIAAARMAAAQKRGIETMIRGALVFLSRLPLERRIQIILDAWNVQVGPDLERQGIPGSPGALAAAMHEARKRGS